MAQAPRFACRANHDEAGLDLLRWGTKRQSRPFFRWARLFLSGIAGLFHLEKTQSDGKMVVLRRFRLPTATSLLSKCRWQATTLHRMKAKGRATLGQHNTLFCKKKETARLRKSIRKAVENVLPGGGGEWTLLCLQAAPFGQPIANGVTQSPCTLL